MVAAGVALGPVGSSKTMQPEQHKLGPRQMPSNDETFLSRLCPHRLDALGKASQFQPELARRLVLISVRNNPANLGNPAPHP